MSTIGIIPIRATSTRFRGKTFAKLCGKSLIEWTIDCCRESQLDDFVVVSSCQHVIKWCTQRGIKTVQRPIGLETDNSRVIHTVSWLNAEFYWIRNFTQQMLLQITNPLRQVLDINESIKLLEYSNSVLSVVDVGEFHPYRMFRESLTGYKGIIPLYSNTQQQTLTQDLPKIWLRDGSIYAWKTLAFKYDITLSPELTLKYEIEKERSIRIDTMKDFEAAEKYLTEGG